MQLKTSTKISLKFSLFTIVIVLFFGILANILFLKNWYTTNNFKLEHKPNKITWPINPLNRPLEFSNKSTEAQKINENIIFHNISKINEEYYMFKKNWNKITIIEITNIIENQISLIKNTIFLIIIFWFLSYFIGLYFVKTTLQKLIKLKEFTENLNLENIQTPFEITWHPKDEINIVAETLNQTLQKIHKQTNSLKEFITNISHEIKTPLMAINSEIDYFNKSKDTASAQNIKKHIKQINKLFEQLTFITKIENTKQIQTELVDTKNIIEDTIETLNQNYKDKNIKRKIELTEEKIKCNKVFFEIIIQNILDNACKYNNPNWTVKVQTNSKQIVVEDTGIWIQETGKIREKFWQEDISKTDIKSFGLGLYLVKKLVKIHKRKINVKSQKWEWTIFTIFII